MSTVNLINGAKSVVRQVLRSRVPTTKEYAVRMAGNFVEGKDFFTRIKRDIKSTGRKLTQETAEPGQIPKTDLEKYIEYLSDIWKKESPTAAIGVVYDDAILLIQSLARYAREVLDKGLQSLTIEKPSA